MVRHIGLVLLTFVVMQMMRRSAEESEGSVKARWQMEVMRDGESPPPLLKDYPPNLRPTAYVLLISAHLLTRAGFLPMLTASSLAVPVPDPTLAAVGDGVKWKQL